MGSTCCPWASSCKNYDPFLDRKFSFSHFSQPCFIEFHFTLADGFSMSSYKSCSIFVPVDPFLQELWLISWLEIQLSEIFSAMHNSLNFIDLANTFSISSNRKSSTLLWLTYFYAPTIKWPGHIVLPIWSCIDIFN